MLDYMWHIIEVVYKVWLAYLVSEPFGMGMVAVISATRPLVVFLHPYL